MSFDSMSEISWKFTGKPYDLNSVLSPDQVWEKLDLSPEEVRGGLNGLIAQLNSVADGDSGADHIGMTPIPAISASANTPQSIIEALATRLQAITDSASGSDFIGLTAIPGVAGTKLQPFLEAFKVYVDAQDSNMQDQITANNSNIFSLQSQININDLDISALATVDGQNVKVTGVQTIEGVKTFSSSPIVPTPTADMQPLTKKMHDEHKASSDHLATKIPYNSTGNTKITGTNVQDALTNAENELKSIIGVNANAEVGSARVSTVKAKTFDDLDARLEESEQDLVTHKADDAIDVKSFALFSDALTASIAQQRPLYIPNGVYDLAGLTFTATDNLIIIGQSKEKTILKNIGKITLNKDFRLENITIIDNTLDGCFVLDPSAFSNVYIRNAGADNTNSAFIDNTRAREFLSYRYGGTDKGIENIVVEYSEFTHFAGYALMLQCQTNRGRITHNKFSEIGYDTNANVSPIFLGYQDGNNIITAPCTNVLISDNIINNIYSAYGTTHGTTECHGIMAYGDRIIIKNNKVTNLYGGGRLPSNLEGGYDHEAIYIKATNSLIDGNYVENGAGNNSDGAITVKSGSDNTISHNVVRGIYGSGIYVISKNILVDSNNVLLTGTGVDAKSCIFVSANTILPSNNHIVSNNLLFNTRTKITGTSGCLILSTIGNALITHNYMYSSSDRIVHISDGLTGNNVKIISNVFECLNALALYIYGTIGVMSEITDNDFIYTTDGSSTGTRQITISDANGVHKIKRNNFYVYGVLTECIQLVCKKYLVTDNDFVLDPVISGTLARIMSVVNNAVSSEYNEVSRNNAIGNSKVTTFFAVYYGATNIGTLHMRDNKATLTDGYLITSNDSAVIVTNDLFTINNYVKTASSTGKTIKTSVTPTANYTSAGNIER